ncbi:MAG: ABC transporter ATP-binding protein [Vulcanibacillus sp.]
MIKLAKYLKPFLLGLVLAIGLLFVQAISDLNLPNFMSDIVNVGIQQNGIEHAAPDAISQEGMNLITTFMDDSEKQLVDSAYELVDGETYSSLYPNAGEQLYVIRETDVIAVENLDNAFEIAAVTFFNVMKEMAAQSGEQIETNAATEELDITMIYQLQPMLHTLPEATISSAHEKAIAYDEIMLKQSGIMLAKAFYTELGFDLGSLQTGYIIKIGLIMLLIALIGGVATVFVGLLSARIATGVARNLRKDVFSKVESFSNNEFDKFSTASLITRCTNDITQIQMLLMMGIRMICYAPILAIGGIIMAVGKSPSMSWIIALAVIVLLGMILIIMVIALPKFKAIQKLVDKLNLVSRENLSGLMVVRAFGTQNHEKKRFDVANKDLTDTSLFINRVMVFMMPVMMFIMNGTTVLVVWVGAHQIADSAMNVGDMMAFMQYAMQVIMSFLMLSLMFILVPRAAVSADRIVEVLETEISIVDSENPKNFNSAKKGLVEFKNVYFRYHAAEEDALIDISFTAEPGQTTAIIGPTGSGKTTLVNLILRFYDVSKGQLLVNGVDVREVEQEELRSKIGYVPQKGVLFSGTIASNLRYGNKEASDEEMDNAATIAQAMEFISEKPEQFASIISQGGSNVSGGQKQRLAIGRALIKNPEILIFDDSFSALDFKTDSALRKALKEHTGGSTVIVVAQRVSTIMNAEQIIVLDQGKVVGCGTHKELLEICPEYYEIASSQLSKEELA